MKCICCICGKEFNGRANATVCSAICRMERNKRYAAKYRKKNPDKVRAQQRAYWNKTNVTEELDKIKQSDNLDLTFNPVVAPDPKPKKKKKAKKPQPQYTGSKWAKVYTKADRLTKISMLSGALSLYEIAHLTYGQLSLIWDTDKYNKLLQQVVNRKREESQA